jgi:membrane-anchored protein YejM (alkaline phosphatase superfamily)
MARSPEKRRSPTTACSRGGWSSAACVSSSSITAAGTRTAPHSARTSSRSCRTCAAQTDRPIYGLLTDLKQRGLLDDTLVVWGGEFGRTPMNEARTDRSSSAGIIIRGRSRCGSPAAASSRV